MNYYSDTKLPWVSLSAASGVAAGATSKACVYPLDVLKKRIQIRGFETARKQFGKVCVIHIHLGTSTAIVIKLVVTHKVQKVV